MTDLSGHAIGVIGLGLMGKPMARNLARAGANLVVHNRSKPAIEELIAEGMAGADTPRAVADGADTVILMLTDTAAVASVLYGEVGLIAGLRRDALVIDMGSTRAVETRAFAAAVAKAGGHYVDAPVSGGQIGAINATLAIMVGADDEDFWRATPILAVLGEAITHVGGVGAGQVAKSANQMIVGLTIGAVAEALALVRAAGVEPAAVRRALMGGFAASRVLEVHGQRMIDGAFEPGGRVVTQEKDMADALALAAHLELDLPSLRTNHELWRRAIESGYGDIDHCGLFKIYPMD